MMDYNPNHDRIDNMQDVQSLDAERALQEERRGDWWIAKHPNACPYCGSYDGMESWYADELVDLHQWATGLKWYIIAGDEHRIYTPCSYCDTDTTGYISIDYEYVTWFAIADPMEADYELLAHEPHRGDELDAAEGPAVQ